MPARRFAAPPRDVTAEPICLLTREWASMRLERADRFLTIVASETPTARGIDYTLPAQPDLWPRVLTFIHEEGECCPFLGFEAEEDEAEIRLSVYWPEESSYD